MEGKGGYSPHSSFSHPGCIGPFTHGLFFPHYAEALTNGYRRHAFAQVVGGGAVQKRDFQKPPRMKSLVPHRSLGRVAKSEGMGGVPIWNTAKGVPI